MRRILFEWLSEILGYYVHIFIFRYLILLSVIIIIINLSLVGCDMYVQITRHCQLIVPFTLNTGHGHVLLLEKVDFKMHDNIMYNTDSHNSQHTFI